MSSSSSSSSSSSAANKERDEATCLIVPNRNSSLQQDDDKSEDENNNAAVGDKLEPLPSSRWEHCVRIVKLAIPNFYIFIFIFLTPIVATAFLGRRQDASDAAVLELSAFLFAASLQNLVGFSTITGACVALDTLLPQAIGKVGPKHPFIFVIIQRLFAVVFYFIAIVLVPIFATAPSWLHHVLPASYEPLAALAGRSMQLMSATLIPYLCFEVLQCYLVGALNHANVIVIGTAVAAASNALFQFLLQRYVGFDGAPIGWTLTLVVMVATTAFGAHRVGAFDSWQLTASGAWRNLIPSRKHYMVISHALPTCFGMLAEWASQEGLNFLASHILNSQQLAAQLLIYQQLVFLFALILSIGISTGVYIGQDVGRRTAAGTHSAKECAIVTVVMTIVECIFTATVFMSLRHTLAGLFTTHEGVIDITVKTAPYALISHFCDVSYFIAACMLRAHGRQAEAMAISIFGYWFVSLPCAYVFATRVMPEEPNIGIWIGASIGQATAGIIAISLLLRMSWEQTQAMEDDLTFDEEDLQ